MSAARWIVLAALLAVGCVYWRPTDARLVRGSTPQELLDLLAEKPDEYRAKAKTTLDAHIGEPFPNLTLIDWSDRTVRLEAFRGQRVAVLAGNGPCPETLKWVSEFEAAAWKPPAGFDRLLLLVSGKSGGSREWSRIVHRLDDAYLVGFPLEDYLAVVRWMPVMYGVDTEGRFEGYWSYGEPSPPP